MDELDKTARLFGLIAVRAGNAIMQIHSTPTSPQYKSDGSPVTEADIEADRIIRSCLKRNLPELPVVSEETSDLELPADHGRFILVDPLDGTKEFIQGRPEFTVNIALVEDGSPSAGAVYAPALRELYVGGTTAYKLHVEPGPGAPSFAKMQIIQACYPLPRGLRAVTSRSHLDEATKAWLNSHPVSELIPSGSSLKFCAIAEGAADVYPRLAPTMEWDTAAGHAVLAAAGGRVVDPVGRDLCYGKPDFRNGDFVAWGGRPVPIGA